ncbi:MAG: hypothetical protein CL916_15255 [Deltaproteobacteria bacterium]|nr:hypothetical protein [Deltaproteobacteria bacterium]
MGFELSVGDFGSGKTYVILGARLASANIQSLSDGDFVLHGEESGAYYGDNLGYALSSVWDYNAYGFDDILIDAIYHSGVANAAGTSYLVYGGQ